MSQTYIKSHDYASWFWIFENIMYSLLNSTHFISYGWWSNIIFPAELVTWCKWQIKSRLHNNPFHAARLVFFIFVLFSILIVTSAPFQQAAYLSHSIQQWVQNRKKDRQTLSPKCVQYLCFTKSFSITLHVLLSILACSCLVMICVS